MSLVMKRPILAALENRRDLRKTVTPPKRLAQRRDLLRGQLAEPAEQRLEFRLCHGTPPSI